MGPLWGPEDRSIAMIAASPSRLLLVTGAGGKTGLAILRRLAALRSAELRVRALARSPSQASTVELAGAQETAVADLLDEAAVRVALDGVDIVYHICPNVHPEEALIGEKLIALCRSAGCRRFVLHSVLEPRIQAMPHHWAKARVEALLAESGLDFTVLQPAPYMQNILSQRRHIAESGSFSVPYALSTRVSMVDLEDVAQAAVKILIGNEHRAATYELCASGLLDQTEIAAALSDVLGREIRAAVLERSTWSESARAAGVSPHQADTLLAMFRYYERFGMAGSAEPLERLLGRRPTTFAEFAQREFG